MRAFTMAGAWWIGYANTHFFTLRNSTILFKNTSSLLKVIETLKRQIFNHNYVEVVSLRLTEIVLSTYILYIGCIFLYIENKKRKFKYF
jgi:hypothetical protein